MAVTRGLDAAGKTTFVRRLNGDDVDSVAPTLGFSIYTFSFQGSDAASAAAPPPAARAAPGALPTGPAAPAAAPAPAAGAALPTASAAAPPPAAAVSPAPDGASLHSLCVGSNSYWGGPFYRCCSCVWDVGGQRTIRAFWRHYFECTDGLIWVVDSADRQRMQTCKQELHRLLKEEETALARFPPVSFPSISSSNSSSSNSSSSNNSNRKQQGHQEKKAAAQLPRLAGAPVLILANKQDVPSALSPDEIRQELELEAMAASRHWAVLPCSAKAGSGLLEGMQWIVSDVSSKIFVHL
ncbi:hypothetical protein Emag_006708 [Eimeria magna]